MVARLISALRPNPNGVAARIEGAISSVTNHVASRAAGLWTITIPRACEESEAEVHSTDSPIGIGKPGTARCRRAKRSTRWRGFTLRLSTQRQEAKDPLSRNRRSVHRPTTYRRCSGRLAQLYRPVVVAMIPVRMV
jgi:hypothetical protein